MLNSLYQGALVDYVICQECGFESQREDTFMDISLTIKNEFDNIYNKSVQEALENYIASETLSGKNQYQCDKCNKKVNALKGLKFKKFPPLLTLQLKRFALNYQTMMRIKLNDYVSFPVILNVNRYISQQKELP